jgi:hypothetical protein
MNTSRFAIALAAIAIALCVWLHFSITDSQEQLQAQIQTLSAELLKNQPNDASESSLSTVTRFDSKALATDIADTVVQAIHDRLPAAGTQASGSVGTVGQEPTDEQIAAADQAEQIFQSALASGTLTRADVMQMRRLRLKTGGGAAFRQLTHEIFAALNSGKLVAEDPTMVLP